MGQEGVKKCLRYEVTRELRHVFIVNKVYSLMGDLQKITVLQLRHNMAILKGQTLVGLKHGLLLF